MSKKGKEKGRAIVNPCYQRPNKYKIVFNYLSIYIGILFYCIHYFHAMSSSENKQLLPLNADQLSSYYCGVFLSFMHQNQVFGLYVSQKAAISYQI